MEPLPSTLRQSLGCLPYTIMSEQYHLGRCFQTKRCC